MVYLDIEVDMSLIEDGHEFLNKPASEGAHGFINEDGENHLIIPIGMVRLDEENKKVLTKEIDRDTFAKTKRFSKGADIERTYEVVVLDHYIPDSPQDELRKNDEGFYDRPEFKKLEE